MEIKLKDWQEAVVNCIKGHNDLVGEEKFMSLPQYEINSNSCIKVRFPSGYGHTWLAAYLSASLDAVVLYSDVEHLKEIQKYWDNEFKNICPNRNRKAISVYEIFYAAHYASMAQKPSNQTVTLQQMKEKIKDKIVIVDQASELPSSVEGWIMVAAENAIVLLD